jgi:hypothetical protein
MGKDVELIEVEGAKGIRFRTLQKKMDRAWEENSSSQRLYDKKNDKGRYSDTF